MSELARIAQMVPVKALRAFGQRQPNGSRHTAHCVEESDAKRKAIMVRMVRVLTRSRGQKLAGREICERLGIEHVQYTQRILKELHETGQIQRHGLGKKTLFSKGEIDAG